MAGDGREEAVTYIKSSWHCKTVGCPRLLQWLKPCLITYKLRLLVLRGVTGLLRRSLQPSFESD